MFYKPSPKKLVILDLLEVVFSILTITITITLCSMGRREYLFLIGSLMILFCLYHGITNLIHDINFLPEKDDKKISVYTMSCNK